MEAHDLQDTNEVNTFLPTSDNILRFDLNALFFLLLWQILFEPISLYC
jgi:hypothetical protein